MSAPIRIAAPKTAQKGEIIELKALIQHDMESGYRFDERGKTIPRNILTKFECVYNDDIIFSANYYPGIAANPFLTFYTTATESGTLIFKWTEQTGQMFSDQVDIVVT